MRKLIDWSVKAGHVLWRVAPVAIALVLLWQGLSLARDWVEFRQESEQFQTAAAPIFAALFYIRLAALAIGVFGLALIYHVRRIGTLPDKKSDVPPITVLPPKCSECSGNGRVIAGSGTSAWPPKMSSVPCNRCNGSGLQSQP